MARIALSKLVRAVRPLQQYSSQRSSTASRTYQSASRASTLSYRAISIAAYRSFSTSKPAHKGLSPDSEDPKPKEAEKHATAAKPADLSTEKYHEFADQFIEAVIGKMEQLQEKREDVDLEYSAGVLTLNFPPTGTYVINKQPPNKQIWLSSPLSGPKRYDFVISSEGQDSKEGTGAGDWVYLRDGTSMRSLLLKELEVDLEGESYTQKLAHTDE